MHAVAVGNLEIMAMLQAAGANMDKIDHVMRDKGGRVQLWLCDRLDIVTVVSSLPNPY